MLKNIGPVQNKTQKLRIHQDLFYAKAKDEFIKHIINTLKSRGREDGFLKTNSK